MRYLKRVLPYVRPYWIPAVCSIMVTVLSAMVGLLAPWPLTLIVDYVLGNSAPPLFIQVIFGNAPSRVGLLLLAVLAGLAVTLFAGLVSVVAEFTNTWLEQRIVLDFRADLFRHAEHLSVAHTDRVSSMRLMYGINFEAAAAGSLIMALQPLAQSALTLIGMLWISVQIDSVLALLSLTVVPFLYYSVGYYTHHIQSKLLQVKGMEADSLAIVHEAMQMLRVVVAFGREQFEHDRFYTQGNRTVDARVKLTFQQTLFSLAVNMTTAVGTALVLGIGAYHALQGQLSTGQLLVVLSYIGAVYKPLEAISFTIGSLQDKFAGLSMAFSVLDTAPEVKEAPDALQLERARGDITFENVSFDYPGRQETLKDISFEAKAGQVIAVVGPTGAGKTTLMNLIPRFYDPAQGRVYLDGIDVRQIGLESLRDYISLVPQEPVLFSGTIADNIRYGRLDATPEEIEEAAKAANAHEFIKRLPNGYAATVGERGVQLSGGERQRICVARAFVKDAPILILDEPTSSIDSKTEAVILDALDRLMVGRTTFMIAHRLSTVRHSDLILVLNQGKLLEMGTHQELLRANGLYKQLHDIQIGEVNKPRRLGPVFQVPPSEEPESAATAVPVTPAPEFRKPHIPIQAVSKRKIVLLGMMSRHPEPGVVWQTLHYLVGLRKLGYDPYYVEAHGVTPNRLMDAADEDSAAKAAAFISSIMHRIAMTDRWAFQALHSDGRCYGLSERQLQDLYGSAELIINLHGGTAPRPEHYRTGRLIYLETDPVQLQVELFEKRQETIDFLEPHAAFFTFGENYGQPDCLLPLADRFSFKPTRQPVVLDLWGGNCAPPEACFTTIGNWRQKGREVTYKGETYTWSKHLEFLKFLDLPLRAGQTFELAISGYTLQDQDLLQSYGWRVIPAKSVSKDLVTYRSFIQNSLGEFTVAKDQNIRLRTGWFSDRSATYLASAKPVITQDTGFGNVLPTGVGLFGFSTMEDILAAVEVIKSDPVRHSRAALEIANAYFDHAVVLTRLLSDIGAPSPDHRAVVTAPPLPAPLPAPANPGEPLAPEDCRVQIEAKLPDEMYTRSIIDVDCSIDNLGRAELATVGPHPVHISYKWLDQDTGQRLPGVEGLRTGFLEPLRPSKTCMCRASVQAPDAPGTYRLCMTLVQENVTWFDDQLPANACLKNVKILLTPSARDLVFRVSNSVEAGF